MNTPSKAGFAGLLRFALIETLVVLLGFVFVRREVYLGGHFSEMLLHWQEYALLGLAFVDGLVRGQTRALYSSPFRKKVLRYSLPFGLFLYVACSSLCDKLNVACIKEDWFRDLGLMVLGAGVILQIRTQSTRPKELIALMTNPSFALESEEKAMESAENATEGAGEDSLKSEESTQASSADEHNSEKSHLQTGDEPGAKLSENLASPEEPANDKSSKEGTSIVEGDTVSENNVDDVSAIAFSIESLQGPWKLLRYPGRSAILLELVGVSMVLGAYMPLFTLPGLVILFKWELADLEAFRTSQLGQEYVNYKERSWLLVPYVY